MLIQADIWFFIQADVWSLSAMNEELATAVVDY